MTGSDIKGFAAAANVTALFIPYAAFIAVQLETMGTSWFASFSKVLEVSDDLGRVHCRALSQPVEAF